MLEIRKHEWNKIILLHLFCYSMQCRILSCIVQMTLLYHYRHYHHRYPNIKHYGAKEEASSDTRRVNVNWKTISDYVCVSYEHDFLLKWIVKKSMIFLHWFQENLFSRSISLANTQVEKQFYIVYRVYFCEMAEVYMNSCQVYPAFRWILEHTKNANKYKE